MQFVGLECIITGFVDEFSALRRYKKSFKLFICFTLFLVGIPCCTQVSCSLDVNNNNNHNYYYYYYYLPGHKVVWDM